MNNIQHYHVPEDTLLAAEREAEFNAKKGTWFFIGFCGNILGVLIASVYEPIPPASRLLEKTPEFTALYTDAYIAKGRSVQLRQSAIGFAVAIGLAILFAILTS